MLSCVGRLPPFLLRFDYDFGRYWSFEKNKKNLKYFSVLIAKYIFRHQRITQKNIEHTE